MDILANLALYDEDGQFNGNTWYFINNTPSVIGFLGGERPTPLTNKEVDSIINQVEEKKDAVKPKVQFEPGETVKITDGPFMNLSGVIEEVDPERGKLKILVTIFGRETLVELEYWQVERTTE